MTTTNTAASAAATTGPTTGATGSASPTVEQARARLTMDEQKFLQLLTTQLRNQDPTQPLDANTMTQQLAQFSGVEQQISTNAHLTSLLALQQSSALVAAAPLVGQQVDVASDQVVLQGGVAQEIRLPRLTDASGATRARIVITNAAGNVVRETMVPLGSDAQGWNWDGRNGQGARAPDGNYRVAVAGLDQQGAPRGTIEAAVTGVVSAIGRGQNEPQVSIGGLTVPLSALRRAR